MPPAQKLKDKPFDTTEEGPIWLNKNANEITSTPYQNAYPIQAQNIGPPKFLSSIPSL